MGNTFGKTLGNVAYIFVPFSDISHNWVDPLIIVAAVVWSIVIESYGLTLPYGADENALMIGILSATLGFLLSK